MCKDQYSTNPQPGEIYTLAQNGTSILKNSAITLNGKGSDLSNKKALKGRAKRKLITQSMMLSLVDIADRSGNEKQKKSYWNTYHCQNKILSANGRLYGKYCKNRFCTLCCCIRKATIINRYLPVLQAWPQPYFLTLTIRAQPLKNINTFIPGLIRGFKKIYAKLKKRHQRGIGIKVMGIRSLECNFNPEKRSYNPHFHLIVPNEEIADMLISEWLRIWTSKYALPVAQKKSRIFSNQTALIEIVKYGSKIFTEPDIKKKNTLKKGHNIHAAALSNIFTAMKGLRIFERFGFNLSRIEFPDPDSTISNEFTEWEFDITKFDWFNIKGEQLTNYNPEDSLIELLKSNIEVNLE